MASQGQIQASTHAVSRDRGIHRRGILSYGSHKRLAHLREFAGCRSFQSSDFLEFGSDGEKSLVPANNQRSRLLCELEQQFREGQHTGPCQAICTVFGSQPKKNKISFVLHGKQWGDYQPFIVPMLPDSVILPRKVSPFAPK